MEKISACLQRAPKWLCGPIGLELKMLETAHAQNHEFQKCSGCFVASESTPCVLAFPHYDKYLRGINLRGGKFMLAHDFRSFDPWSLGDIVVG